MTVTATMPETIGSSAERDAKRKAIAEARAAVVEGRVVSHQKMSAWLDSWGKPGELPPPSQCK